MEKIATIMVGILKEILAYMQQQAIFREFGHLG